MSLALIFDTETTGLPNFKEPSDDPRQPHIVQFAALLVDEETREEVDSIDMIVKPDGWVIPPELTEIHGISQERAMEVGYPEDFVTGLYVAMLSRAAIRVAHNASFDDRIMRIAMLRTGKFDREVIKEMEARPKFCTAIKATPVVNLPPTAKMLAAGFKKAKTPSVTECIQHFFGEEMEGAHNALYDVRACARIYFKLKDLEAANGTAS